jgi:hypothetical protein
MEISTANKCKKKDYSCGLQSFWYKNMHPEIWIFLDGFFYGNFCRVLDPENLIKKWKFWNESKLQSQNHPKSVWSTTTVCSNIHIHFVLYELFQSCFVRWIEQKERNSFKKFIQENLCCNWNRLNFREFKKDKKFEF